MENLSWNTQVILTQIYTTCEEYYRGVPKSIEMVVAEHRNDHVEQALRELHEFFQTDGEGIAFNSRRANRLHVTYGIEHLMENDAYFVIELDNDVQFILHVPTNSQDRFAGNFYSESLQ